MPFNYYNEEPMLKPEQIAKPVSGFPSTIIATWQGSFLKSAKAYGMEDGWTVPGESGYKVHKVSHEGKDYGLVYLAPGGPNVAFVMEELIVKGAKHFVFIGSCGVIGQDIRHGIVIPERAYRDEGVSWHYIPDKEEYIDVDSAQETKKIVSELGFDYYAGSTWTTDTIYRETPSAVEYYRQKGCIVVEMECAAIMAVARYRNVKAHQILFTADSLQSGEWQKERLMHMHKNIWDAYFDLAIRFAGKIS